jgi:hypothetical protein
MTNRIKQGLKRMSWTSSRNFELDGLSYLVDIGSYQHRTDLERLVILKAPDYWGAYAQGVRDAPTRNILELGVWQGGSAMAFSSLLAPEKLVAIDICDPIDAFDQIRARHPAGEPVRVYYNTSQGDRARLEEIIRAEFAEPLDLVIDDASHDYHLTKSAFETIFPHLKPNGIYAIEDWGWAHSQSFALWTDKPAMSNLIYQLLMVNAGRPDLISSVHVFRGVAFVRKGPKAPVGEPFELEKTYWTQERPFRLL